MRADKKKRPADEPQSIRENITESPLNKHNYYITNNRDLSRGAEK